MASAIIEAATDAPSARYINPIVSVLNGTDAHKGYINVVKWGHATTPTGRFCNTNTSGESLVAFAANGTTKILAANNTGVSMAGDLVVSGNGAISGTLVVTGLVTANSGLTVNNAALTANSTAVFNAALTANSSAVFNGNVTIGDTSGDTLSVTATSNFFTTLTVRDGSGVNFPLVANPSTNRTLIGTNTAISGAPGGDVLNVAGQAVFAPGGAADTVLHIWRSTSAGSGWGVGVTSSDQLKFTDNGGQGIMTIGDTSSTYQIEVTGDGHITDDFVVDGALSADTLTVAAAATFEDDLIHTGTNAGFFGTTAAPRENVTGVLSGSPTLPQLTGVVRSMLAALDQTACGLWIDATT